MLLSVPMWFSLRYSTRFRLATKKQQRCAWLSLCEGDPPMNGEFPAGRDSNAENVFNWWRHNGRFIYDMISTLLRLKPEYFGLIIGALTILRCSEITSTNPTIQHPSFKSQWPTSSTTSYSAVAMTTMIWSFYITSITWRRIYVFWGTVGR